MTLHRRGRGGWVNKGGRAASLVGLVALGFVVGTGCSSKTKGVGGEGNPVGSESNLGSQG